ncbi:HisA/HisF-related TIM barrel protein [Streptomyces albiaxialis]|uniref:HisA/HisF-related TIM barrel protein n=1 Tax=Streptomyces albiaxialis TaxID=329523 RepID=UPI003CD05DD2
MGDGHVPETARTDPIQAALAFQEQGARWLHLVVAEDEGEGGGLAEARRIIDAVDLDVQLMCRAGIHDDAALNAALDTGCARRASPVRGSVHPGRGAGVHGRPAPGRGLTRRGPADRRPPG